MSFVKKLLHEVTAFPLSLKGKQFFYGLSTEEEAYPILSSGFSDTEVFLSRSLGDALTQAILPVGRTMPLSRIKLYGEWGYVFVTTPRYLTDVEPSPESVGLFVQELYQQQYGSGSNLDPRGMDFLSFAWDVLDRKEQLGIIHDESNMKAEVGRTLLLQAPTSMILWMLSQDTYPYELVNLGGVKFQSAYRLNRRILSSVSERNFFSKAEKVKSWEKP